MPVPKHGGLDRFIQFERQETADDGFGRTTGPWEAHGPKVQARKADISDSEAWRAAEVGATVTTRFVVRCNALTMGVTPKDRLRCEGLVYDIVGGPKEVYGRRRFLEFSCIARTDQ